MVLPLSGKSSDFITRLLPYQSHFMEIDGYQMHYLDEGPREAPVVLLLHGNPTWCFYYRQLLEVLRPAFRVIAPDYIGCGLSEHPTDAHFRAVHRIDHLEQFVGRLGIKRFSLVMHDWGGSIGTALALRRPEAIEKLVYLNTTLTETESLPKVIKTAARPVIGRFLTKHTKHFLKLTTTLGASRKLPKDVRRGYYYPYKTRARRTAIWDFVADIPFDSSHPSYSNMLEMADGLPKLSHVPVQIVWGLKDLCFHREMLNKVAQHFPQAAICEIPEASHLVLEDAPELANRVISEFLRAPGEMAEVRSVSALALEQSGMNPLYQAFCEIAKHLAHKNAVIVPSFFLDVLRYEHLNFRDLMLLINKYQRGLEYLGLRNGDRVLMLVPPGIDFLALSYAIFGRGAIPVFVDPGMGRENVFRCIKSARPNVMIGSPKAQLLRLKRRELFPELKFHITASEWFYTGGPTLSYLKKFSSRPLPEVEAPETALIAFTSGATGTPKGVVFTRDMLREQLRIFSEVFGIEAGRKDLPLLPVFSLFSLACGVCSVFAPLNPAKPLELEPDKIAKIIDDLEVDYSFGSPALWTRIGEYCVRSRAQLPSLKRIFMAGAPVSKATLNLVKGLLKTGEIYTPYGATEALPVTFVSGAEILANQDRRAISGEIGTFVGRNVPGVDLRIMKAVDGELSSIESARFLPAGEIGEVLVRGRNVSPEYFEQPGPTAQAKVRDGAGFWHRMGDMGYLDEQGSLYFCGRKAHIVRAGGQIFYSVPVERIFNQHPRIKRTALVEDKKLGQASIAVEPLPQHWPESEEARLQFARELLDIGQSDPISAPIAKVYFHQSFPVDARHNAKIFRDRLSDMISGMNSYGR